MPDSPAPNEGSVPNDAGESAAAIDSALDADDPRKHEADAPGKASEWEYRDPPPYATGDESPPTA